MVRVIGNEHVLPPIDHTWDSFFFSDNNVSDDFMETRNAGYQAERESL